MESVDFLAMCTCIYSTSRERKRLFGFCFNPWPGSRLGKSRFPPFHLKNRRTFSPFTTHQMWDRATS